MEFGIISLGDNRADPLTGRVRTAVERHREVIELAEKAEERGFDSFHIGEHHGCDYITSTPPVILGAIAMKTDRIRLSTSTALLPTRDPVVFAEDYATVDVLSNGRAEVIVSRGIIARTYADLGYDYADSRSLFKEHIELVLELWRNENVSWQGKHRTPLAGYTVQPRPVQSPSPPLWIAGGFTEDSVLLAAELGLPLMLPSVLRPPTEFRELVELYRTRFQDRGSGPSQVGALSHVNVAKDLDTAVKRYGSRHCDYMEWIARELMPWGFEPLVAAGAPEVKIPWINDFEHLRTEGPVVAGSSQQVLDRLVEFKSACQLDRYLFHVDVGALPLEAVFETVERLSDEVLPKLRSA